MSAQAIGPVVTHVFLDAAQQLKPPPRLTLTEWAEHNIVLSSEDSAEPGRYRAARAPYQRGMQDAILDPEHEEIVFFTSAQVGKTRILLNALGYFIVEDPCGIVFMLPTLELVKVFSLQRLTPMIRDNAALRGVALESVNKAGTGTRQKLFPGGFLVMVGANSPGSLSSMPLRIVLADEEDRYPMSSGEEGDPVELAKKRTTTFWNRKVVHSSTTTIKGLSRIEAKFEASDQRKYWVPCPHCGEFQVLQWKRLTWPKDEAPTLENTAYACTGCAAALYESDKLWMLQRGEWRAARPEEKKCCGFWINELYSPFVKWHEMAAAFLAAYLERDTNPEKLKTFVNLALAESWEDRAEVLDGSELQKRCENYPPPALPDGVTMLTAGADVQADRIEMEVVGWGKGEESWSVDWLRFEGDTATAEPWEKLDAWLRDTRYLHARGVRLEIACVLVDSGFRSAEVYAWTGARNDRWIFAAKGIAGFGKPPLQRWNTNNRPRVRMYPVGVDVIKELLYARLRIEADGAGKMHFSREKNDAEYFAQLTAEKLARKYHRGFPVRFWEKKPGARNEALDCRVYAYAALLALSKATTKRLEQWRVELLERARLAAEMRRAKVDPNQLALLEQTALSSAALSSKPEGLQTSAGDKPEHERAAEAKPEDAGLGAAEYLAAETLDPDAREPEAAAQPGIVVRKRF